MAPTTDVLILGAGVAGLKAGIALKEAGLSVCIVEARDRVGGRVYSFLDSQKRPVELGAEFVHGIHASFRPLISRFNLKLLRSQGRRWVQQRDTQFGLDSSLFESTDNLIQQLVKENPGEFSVAEALSKSSLNPNQKRILTKYIEGFHAADPEKMGLQELAYTERIDAKIHHKDSEENSAAYRIQGTYEQLVLGLQNELSAELVLNSPIQKLVWKVGAVEAISEVGRSFKARSVLITFPIAVLKRFCFVPELLHLKSAWENIHMGKVLKLLLLFEKNIFAEVQDESGKSLADVSFIDAAGGDFPAWWMRFPEHSNVVAAWTGGPAAIALGALSNDELRRRALSSFSSLSGLSRTKLDPLCTGFYFHDWNNDPFSLGSYSYLGVRGLKSQALCKAPIENTLFFAGEALGGEASIGTVDAALSSADRAVREILLKRAP